MQSVDCKTRFSRIKQWREAANIRRLSLQQFIEKQKMEQLPNFWFCGIMYRSEQWYSLLTISYEV